MSSTYTGDRTLAEAPSAVPAPDTVPTLTLPSDGDADNAASVAQAFKALANELTWAKFPTAKPSQWEQAILVPFNARNQRRAYIDHHGHRQIAGVEVDQDWREHINGDNWPTSGVPWTAFVTTGTVIKRGPTNVAPGQPLFPTVKITPPTSAAERSTVTGPGMCVPSDDLGAHLKWLAALDVVGSNRTTIAMGLGDGPSGSTGAVPAWGAWFEKDAGDTNWQCKVNGTGSGPLTASSGVPPTVNTFQTFRIDLVGANVADDTAGHAIFFIDGAQVAILDFVVSAMPSSADPVVPFFSSKTTTTAGAAVSLYLGPVAYRQNTAVNAL